MIGKEQRMVDSSSYEGPERRRDNGFCDKTCSNHEDIKEGLKEMNDFKDVTIGKMSKCITALGILFIVFTSSLFVSSSAFLKGSEAVASNEALEEKVDSYIMSSKAEHKAFADGMVKMEVLNNKFDYMLEDMQEIKMLIKERL